METTSNYTSVHTHTTNPLTALFNQQVENFETSRFGWMAIYITVQSCVGAIAAAFILQNNASIWMLCCCAAIAMASNSFFIAQGDKKLCMVVFYLSILVNIIFIAVNI